MMSVKELAKALSVSAKTIYALCDEGAIPYYRIGKGRGTLRFELAEVKKALRPDPKDVPLRQAVLGKHLDC